MQDWIHVQAGIPYEKQHLRQAGHAHTAEPVQTALRNYDNWFLYRLHYLLLSLLNLRLM